MRVRWPVFIALLVAIGLAFLVAYLPGPDANTKLTLGIGYALLILIFMFGVAILIDMVTGKIDLSHILDEVDGGASMSRFQLLIFTFVIALSFFIIVAARPSAGFPEVPAPVIMLLGISASTYAVSKGIHMGNQSGPPEDSEEDKNKSGGAGGHA